MSRIARAVFPTASCRVRQASAIAHHLYHAGGAADKDKTVDYLPPHPQDQMAVEPIYETVPGWSESTAGARSWAELPAAAIKYIRRIEELIRCPVALVSTSPERADTILVRDPFAD